MWTREQRLAAMEAITLPEVVDFAKTFLDGHSLETLYYGNLTKEQARELTDLLVGERADYLERRAGEIGATVEVNSLICQLWTWSMFALKDTCSNILGCR